MSMTRSTSTFDPGLADQAYKLSIKWSPAQKGDYILRTIGPRIAAAALGLSDARPLKSWIHDGVYPKQSVEWRLETLFRVVYAISETYSPATAASFLRSSNPQLDDEAPLIVLADGSPYETGPKVLAAARAFLEG